MSPNLLVLAGGAGTRLQPAVSDVPKPLAPVAGKPFLHFLIESWIAQGITEMTFLLHDRAKMIAEFLRGQNGKIKIVVEPKPMGTGGAIAFAVRELGLSGNFLVANADTWLGGGIREIAQSAAPAVAIVKVGNATRYGSIMVENNKVASFEEKRTGSGWINAGLYHLNSDLFSQWDGKAFSLERDLFPPMALSGQLGAAQLHSDFIDIGIPEDYFRFCRWIESGKTCPL